MNPDSATDRSLTELLCRRCLSPEGVPADHARGTLAGLRKLLSKTMRNQGLFTLGSIGFRDWKKDPAAETVAGLFGLYPHRMNRSRNFGTTCRDLASKGEATPGNSPFDRHFRRLLACRVQEDLMQAVIAIGRVAKAENVEINYHRLHDDLRSFRREPDAILESWTKSYFKTIEPGDKSEP